MKKNHFHFAFIFFTAACHLLWAQSNPPDATENSFSSPLMMFGGESHEEPKNGGTETAATRTAQQRRATEPVDDAHETSENQPRVTLENFQTALNDNPDADYFIVNDNWDVVPTNDMAESKRLSASTRDFLETALQSEKNFVTENSIYSNNPDSLFASYENDEPLTASELRRHLQALGIPDNGLGLSKSSIGNVTSSNHSQMETDLLTIPSAAFYGVAEAMLGHGPHADNMSAITADVSPELERITQDLKLTLSHNAAISAKGYWFDLIGCTKNYDAIHDAYSKATSWAEAAKNKLKTHENIVTTLNQDPRAEIFLQEDTLPLWEEAIEATKSSKKTNTETIATLEKQLSQTPNEALRLNLQEANSKQETLKTDLCLQQSIKEMIEYRRAAAAAALEASRNRSQRSSNNYLLNKRDNLLEGCKLLVNSIKAILAGNLNAGLRWREAAQAAASDNITEPLRTEVTSFRNLDNRGQYSWLSLLNKEYALERKNIINYSIKLANSLDQAAKAEAVGDLALVAFHSETAETMKREIIAAKNRALLIREQMRTVYLSQD